MKYFLGIIALVFMSGCMTTYSIEKHTNDGSSITVHVKSFREFQQPQIYYNKSTEEVTFTFGAESATTAVSPIEKSIGKVIESGGTIAATIPGNSQ